MVKMHHVHVYLKIHRETHYHVELIHANKTF